MAGADRTGSTTAKGRRHVVSTVEPVARGDGASHRGLKLQTRCFLGLDGRGRLFSLGFFGLVPFFRGPEGQYT